jgi:hypothetical protein
MSGLGDSTRKEVDKIVERILRDGDLGKPAGGASIMSPALSRDTTTCACWERG